MCSRHPTNNLQRASATACSDGERTVLRAAPLVHWSSESDSATTDAIGRPRFSAAFLDRFFCLFLACLDAGAEMAISALADASVPASDAGLARFL